MSEICEGYPNRDVDSKGIRPEVRKLINDLQAGKVDLSLKNYEPGILNMEILPKETQTEVSMIDLESTEEKKVGFLDRIRKTAIVATAAAGLASFTNIVDIKPVQAAENPTAIVEVQQQNVEMEKVWKGFDDKEKEELFKPRDIQRTSEFIFKFKPEDTDPENFLKYGVPFIPEAGGALVFFTAELVDSILKKLPNLPTTAKDLKKIITEGSGILDIKARTDSSIILIAHRNKDDGQNFYYSVSKQPLFGKLTPGGGRENVIAPPNTGRFKFDLDSGMMVLEGKDGSVQYYSERNVQKVSIADGVSVLTGTENGNALSPEFVNGFLKPAFERAGELGLLDTVLKFEGKQLNFLKTSDPSCLASYYIESKSSIVISFNEGLFKGYNDKTTIALMCLIVEGYGLKLEALEGGYIDSKSQISQSKCRGFGKQYMLGFLAEEMKSKLSKAEYDMFRLGCKTGLKFYYKDYYKNNFPNSYEFFEEIAKPYLEKVGIPSAKVEEMLEEFEIIK